jgi:hypothetical protein
MEQLRVLDAVQYITWEDAEKTVPKAEYAECLLGRSERLSDGSLTGDEPIGIQSF